MPERRVAERLPALELPGDEAIRVVVGRVAQRPCRRVERLHDHPAAPLPAPAAAGQLSHQGERALLGAKVGKPESGVGIEHHRQRDRREVVSLGHHLGAHEHPGGRRVEAAQHRAAVAGRRHVGVEPEDGQRAHQLLQLALELLGARRRGAPPTSSRTRRRRAGPARGARSGGRPSRPRRGAAPASRRSPGTPTPARRPGTRGSSTSRAGSAARSPSHRDGARRRAPSACARAARPATPTIPTSSTGGSRRLSTPRAEPQPVVAHDALRARRGAAGEQHGALLAGAALGHHAGVVAGVALLLVRGVVLLVDHDQARGRRTGRTRRSAAPRTRAPLRCACAATRRSARARPGANAPPPRGPRSARRTGRPSGA